MQESTTGKRKKASRGRGEGGIRQRAEDGLWEASVSLGQGPNGKRRRKKVYAATKTEVMKKLDELKSKVSSRTLATAGQLTTAAFMTWWLDNVSKKQTEASTWERYEQLNRLHLSPHLGQTRLADLTELHIEQLYTDMEKAQASNWSRKMAGTLLTNALGYAAQKKLISGNPAQSVAKPKPGHHEICPLTDEQATQFLRETQVHRLHALFALALGSGLRQGELLGLAWSGIAFVKQTVTVSRALSQTKKGFGLKAPKSASGRRTLRLPGFVIGALERHKTLMKAEGQSVDGSDKVFCTRTGNWIAKSNLTRKTFKPLLKKASLPLIRFHDLRHTHATSLLRAGKSIKAVSRRLGHSTVELTLRVYVHVLPADDHDLADTAETLYGGRILPLGENRHQSGTSSAH